MSCIKRPAALGGLALLLAFAWTGASEAAQTVHLKLQIDGFPIDGEVTLADHENEIACDSFDHHIFRAVDPNTGAVTGKSLHRPVKITKRVDQTSPLLVKALASNESVDSAEFHFFRAAPGGGAEHYYTILLENGKISRITTLSPDVLDPAAVSQPVRETVSFTYQKITWTYVPTGVTHTDNWGTPPP